MAVRHNSKQRTSLMVAPALILCCVDYRYIQAVQQFVKQRLKVSRYNLKTDAGGTRALVKGPRAVQAWIWRNLTLAYEQQGVRQVFLFHHQDCLLYGGSKAFATLQQEAATHRQDLRRAQTLLTKRFQGLKVAAFYAHHTTRGITFTAVS